MTSLRPRAEDFQTEIPEEMAARPQWVGWRYGEERASGKPEKIPINPRTVWRAKPDDPTTWGTMEEAEQTAATRGLNGIGYSFNEEDPFTGVDLDNCRNPRTGEIAPWATRIIEAFASYTEVSPSRTGVKIIARGGSPRAATDGSPSRCTTGADSSP